MAAHRMQRKVSKLSGSMRNCMTTNRSWLISIVNDPIPLTYPPRRRNVKTIRSRHRHLAYLVTPNEPGAQPFAFVRLIYMFFNFNVIPLTVSQPFICLISDRLIVSTMSRRVFDSSSVHLATASIDAAPLWTASCMGIIVPFTLRYVWFFIRITRI